MKVKVSVITQDNVEVAKFLEVTEDNYERKTKWVIINFIKTQLEKK